MAGVAKALCVGIMICQMAAILSGVALMYGSVIVIFPSKRELAMSFHMTPIMCTTQHTWDKSTGPKDKNGDKPKCDWKTCSEWCMTKGGSCVQITVDARQNGSVLHLAKCSPEHKTLDEKCSAINENMTYPSQLPSPQNCRTEGQCKQLHGVFNCSMFVEMKPNPPMPDTKIDKNECRKIDPAFKCEKGEELKVDKKKVICNEEDHCDSILRGIYTCEDGQCSAMQRKRTCKKIKVGKDHNLKDDWECDTAQMSDCKRRCTELDMKNRNVVIYSQERLIATTCKSIETPGDDNVAKANHDEDWQNGNKTFFTFCTYVDVKKGNETTDISARDCFNATFGSPDLIKEVKDYRELLEVHQLLAEEATNDTDKWIIPPEESLTMFNMTQLRINPEGCVNSLMDECKSFFETHAHDGFDGYTKDRYPCYYTDLTEEYVIGKFNPAVTTMYLMLASCVPGVLFVVACVCLFLCSKSVGVNKEGEMQVTLLRSEEDPPPVPHPGMEEL